MRPSPVAKLKSVRIMLEIAAFYDYEIWQMDVKTLKVLQVLQELIYYEIVMAKTLKV